MVTYRPIRYSIGWYVGLSGGGKESDNVYFHVTKSTATT